MIFEKIILNNMFSYYGESIFDLTGKTDQKNIVLISGRNGFGKTSFLNSIKLLFTGVTDDLRSEVQSQRRPSPKRYVIGSGDDWWGIINRRAKADNALCSVEIIWRENSEQVIARREWIVQNDRYDEQLSIRVSSKVLKNEEAQSFLDKRLPEEYVPFFFFDGEKIQELASANIARTAEHIERLLNISHVNNLREALKAAIADWRSDGALDQAAEAELEKAKNDYRIVAKKIQAELQQKKEIQYDLEQLEEEIAQLQERQESSRSFISQQDEVSVKRRIKELQQEKEELVNEIGEELPYDIVLLANEKLLSKVQGELNKLLAENSVQDNSLVEQLRDFLPDDIFDRPPFPLNPVLPLSEEQKGFYKEKLIRKLEEYTQGQRRGVNSSFFPLNIADANILQECIQPYLDSRLLRVERKKAFDQLQAVKKKIYQLDEEVQNIGGLSADEKQDYEQRKVVLKEKRSERDELVYQLGKVNSREDGFIKKIEELKREIGRKEQSLEVTKIFRKKIDKAREVQRFFNEYKDRLKKQRKDELGKFINQYFKQLMTSNVLIQHIAVDDNFGVHYQDKDGLPVGMGNLSAGMKQLAATSLLWALKTCSGYNGPTF
ncbi:AAA family ATPase [Candidatus Electrothrix sp.]|uniref:AAA family ATPase n=1 Tax=Candidatus Electrothrix sp. TaxID=2170559 RepID=UPI004055C049